MYLLQRVGHVFDDKPIGPTYPGDMAGGELERGTDDRRSSLLPEVTTRVANTPGQVIIGVVFVALIAVFGLSTCEGGSTSHRPSGASPSGQVTRPCDSNHPLPCVFFTSP